MCISSTLGVSCSFSSLASTLKGVKKSFKTICFPSFLRGVAVTAILILQLILFTVVENKSAGQRWASSTNIRLNLSLI